MLSWGTGGNSLKVCKLRRVPKAWLMTLRPDNDSASSKNARSDKDRRAIEGEFAELDHVSQVDEDRLRLNQRIRMLQAKTEEVCLSPST